MLLCVSVVRVVDRTPAGAHASRIDAVKGKNYDHHKVWIEEQLIRLAFTTEAQRGTEKFPRSGVAVHALGFMPEVLTIISGEMVTIPRVELGGIALATQNWPMIAGRLSTYA